MFVGVGTRPKDCQQKVDFKMKTLNIQTIFAVRFRKYPKTTRSKT
jgi:hypothetical protein